MTEGSTDVRSVTSAATLRALGVALLFAIPVVLTLARPIPFHLIVRDDRGRPVEAVVVRVERAADPHQVVELYTNEAGEVSAEIAGVGKTLDLAINPATAASSVPNSNGAYEVGAGPTYDTERLHGVAPDRYARTALELTLRPRLSTRQVCRLTGYGSASRPYQYAGQDSAITIPYVREVNGRSIERLLWWFGDTVGKSDGPILVSNKMATSDPTADASHCIDLEYVGGRDHGPLVVDPATAGEATVWLDIPLVSSRVPESRPHGGYAFRPDRGDRLSVGYLSVADTKPLFTVTHLGLATASACDDVDCGVAGEGKGIRLEREPDAVWTAPLEYTRAPEGSAFLFGDTYTILKVAERRPYCAAPPHAVDCSATRALPRRR